MSENNYSYPSLTGPAARDQIRSDRAFRDKQDKSDMRFAEMVVSSILVFSRGKARRQESARVRKIIEEHQIYRVQERERSELEELLRNGGMVDMRRLELGPTPEQVSAANRDGAGFERVSEVGQKNSARTGSSVYRRVACPQCYKLFTKNVIDEKGYALCVWYSHIFEQTGLRGNISSTDYSREVFSAPHARSMFTDFQVDSQELLAKIDDQIPNKHLRLLKLVVLEDIPINRASRQARAFRRKPKEGFADAVDELARAKAELEKRR